MSGGNHHAGLVLLLKATVDRKGRSRLLIKTTMSPINWTLIRPTVGVLLLTGVGFAINPVVSAVVR